MDAARKAESGIPAWPAGLKGSAPVPAQRRYRGDQPLELPREPDIHATGGRFCRWQPVHDQAI